MGVAHHKDDGMAVGARLSLHIPLSSIIYHASIYNLYLSSYRNNL
jgi:hypothetical protein